MFQYKRMWTYFICNTLIHTSLFLRSHARFIISQHIFLLNSKHCNNLCCVFCIFERLQSEDGINLLFRFFKKSIFRRYNFMIKNENTLNLLTLFNLDCCVIPANYILCVCMHTHTYTLYVVFKHFLYFMG